MVKLKVPIKNKDKKPAIKVPNYELVLHEYSSSLWLRFKYLPIGRRDILLAYDTNSGEVVGSTTNLLFPYTMTMLWPLMVQMPNKEANIRLVLFSFKKNEILSFPAISIIADSEKNNNEMPSPLNPWVFDARDAVAIKQLD